MNPNTGEDLVFGMSDASSYLDYDDAMVFLQPDDLGRSSSATYTETFPTATYPQTYTLRDVAWMTAGTYVMGAFRGVSGSDYELGFSDGSSSAARATLGLCETPLSVAMDPIDGSTLGWVACSDSTYGGVGQIDVTTAPASSYTVETMLHTGATTSDSTAYYPPFVDVAQNGAFLLIGANKTSGTGLSKAYVIPQVIATSGADQWSTDYEAVDASFTKPRGGAITPMLSIATPRPGTLIGGIKRLHVIVRDIGITSLTYLMDGSSFCSDTNLADGSSEDCQIDASDLDSGPHTLTIVAEGAATGDWEMNVPYYGY